MWFRLLKRVENTAIAAIVISVAFGCWGLSEYASNYAAEKHRQQQQQGTKDLYCDPAVFSSQRETNPILSETVGQPAPYGRHYELCQQWRAAKASERSADVAWFQAWIGVVGLLGLWRTVRWAREAAFHTREAAKQTRRQADLAEGAYRNLERPHVIETQEFRLGFPGPPLDSMPVVKVTVGNFGRSPAILMMSAIHLTVRDERPIDLFTSGNVLVGSQQVLTTEGDGRFFIHEMFYRELDWISARRGQSTLWLIGVLNYRDTQNVEFWREFCWDFDPASRTLMRNRDQFNRSGVGRYPGPWEEA